MKLNKIVGVAVVAALALMAFASTASATTLEVGGTAKNSEVSIEATLASGASALLTDTAGFTANTCTSSTVKGHTSSPFTVSDPGSIGGPITALSWSNCSEGNPTVDAMGTLSVQHISNSTNGTVRSSGAKVTVPSFFGPLTCTTENTDLGTLKGSKSGKATFEINAVLTCTGIGDAKWSGTYTVTSPEGLGVVG